MKRFIIDGYNLLRCSELSLPNHLDLEGERDHLIKLLQSYASHNGKSITVVFDGASSHSERKAPTPNVRIIFSQAKKEADDVIRELIRSERHPEEVVVVSSDRAIKFSAKDHGLKPLSSEEFCRIYLFATHSPPEEHHEIEEKYTPNLNETELEFWKRVFEEDNNDDDSPTPSK